MVHFDRIAVLFSGVMEDDGTLPSKIFKAIRSGAPSAIGGLFNFPADEKIKIEDLIKVIANMKQLQAFRPHAAPEH